MEQQKPDNMKNNKEKEEEEEEDRRDGGEVGLPEMPGDGDRDGMDLQERVAMTSSPVIIHEPSSPDDRWELASRFGNQPKSDTESKDTLKRKQR